MAKEKYSDIKTVEEAVGMLKEQDKQISEQNALIADLNSSNGSLEKKVLQLEKKAIASGALPSFEFNKKNYNFTARKFHITIDGELKLMTADGIVADLESSDKSLAKAAEDAIALMIKNKIGVIEEAK